MKATNVLINLPKGVKGVVNLDLHVNGEWVKEINPGSMTARQMVKAAAKIAKEIKGEHAQVFMYFDCLCIGEVVCTGAGVEVRIYSNEPTEETTDNTPNVSDLARWIDLQLSTIIDGVSAGYTLGNYNSVWIDKGSTVFNVSLANGETVEIDSDNYNTAEEIATAIISTLKNTPATMNANGINTHKKSINGIMNQANRLMSACNAARDFKRADLIRKIAFRYYDNIRACAGRFNYNDDREFDKEYSRAQYMNA